MNVTPDNDVAIISVAKPEVHNVSRGTSKNAEIKTRGDTPGSTSTVFSTSPLCFF